MTAYKACKLYSVNSGTISAHLRGITKSERKGRPPKFNVQQEQVLLDLIFQLASWCFPLSISEVVEMAGQYALTLGLKVSAKGEKVDYVKLWGMRNFTKAVTRR